VRALEALGVHHGGDVGDPLLERGELVECVGSPDPALVELDDAEILGLELEDAPVELVLPHDLHVRHQGRHQDHRWSIAEGLVGELQPIAGGIPGIRHPHDEGFCHHLRLSDRPGGSP